MAPKEIFWNSIHYCKTYMGIKKIEMEEMLGKVNLSEPLKAALIDKLNKSLWGGIEWKIPYLPDSTAPPDSTEKWVLHKGKWKRVK